MELMELAKANQNQYPEYPEYPEYPGFSIRAICETLQINRSTIYYQPKPRFQDPFELEIRDRIEEMAAKYPRYGYRRIAWLLRREGYPYPIGYRRVARIMKEENLLVQVKRYCKTTRSEGGIIKYPNLLQQTTVDHPDQIWCGDITYIRLRREFVYLAVLIDVFTRGIRGWELKRGLDDQLTIGALDKALKALSRSKGKGKPEIHHSDNGVQYLSADYVAKLNSLKVAISVSAKGKAWENSYAERVIRTLKEEEVYLHEYEDIEDARRRVGYFLEEVYMKKRPHSSLGYMTPAEFEQDYGCELLR